MFFHQEAGPFFGVRNLLGPHFGPGLLEPKGIQADGPTPQTIYVSGTKKKILCGFYSFVRLNSIFRQTLTNKINSQKGYLKNLNLAALKKGDFVRYSLKALY